MAKVKFNSKRISEQQARSIESATLVEGARTREQWRRQAGAFLNQFRDVIRTSMNNGESLQQATTRVVGGTVDGIPTQGVMKTTRARANALVSTSVNAVQNGARLATFQANTDVIKGVQQVSTLDNLTSGICIAYSGQAWNVETLAPIPPATLPFNGGPPRHFNCRSTLVPVIKSFRELGINRKEIPPGTQASLDGQVPGDQTFEQWIGKKSKIFQDKVLGRARARLWRNKKITLTQLVDMRGNALTLDQLEAKFGIS
jgi:hypothetical protein